MPHNLRWYKSDSDAIIPGGSLSAPRGFVGTQIWINYTRRWDLHSPKAHHLSYMCLKISHQKSLQLIQINKFLMGFFWGYRTELEKVMISRPVILKIQWLWCTFVNVCTFKSVIFLDNDSFIMNITSTLQKRDVYNLAVKKTC